MGDLVDLRLGVLGLSPGNGHPFSFSAIINGYDDDAFRRAGWPAIHDYLRNRAPADFGFDGVRVTCAWTPDPDLTKRLAAACRIEQVIEEPAAMLGRVDAVLVLRDDAESHLPLCLPFLQRGTPVFVDKPLALRSEELARFEPYLHSGKLMSCAGFRFATELDPLRSRLHRLGRLKLIKAVVVNDWSRYGIHMVDAVMGLGIAYPTKVQRLPALHDSVVLSLEDGATFTIDALQDVPKIFNIAFYGSAGSFTAELSDNFGAFQRLIAAFLNQVRSGLPAILPDETLTSIRTVIAGLHSSKDGGPQDIGHRRRTPAAHRLQRRDR